MTRKKKTQLLSLLLLLAFVFIPGRAGRGVMSLRWRFDCRAGRIIEMGWGSLFYAVQVHRRVAFELLENCYQTLSPGDG